MFVLYFILIGYEKTEAGMKKLILVLNVIFMAAVVNAAEYDYGVKEACYNPQTSLWATKKQTDNDICLTYRGYVGSGGFSEYRYQDGKLAIGPVTNIEFITEGNFIGINSHDLKFVKYLYNDGQVKSVFLTEEEVQKLYPDYEIVKISQFKDNELTISKKIFTKKKVLLLNDTRDSFYKYTYKPAGVNSSGIKPFVKISQYMLRINFADSVNVDFSGVS